MRVICPVCETRLEEVEIQDQCIITCGGCGAILELTHSGDVRIFGVRWDKGLTRGQPVTEVPACPVCKTHLAWKGQQPRKLVCPHCQSELEIESRTAYRIWVTQINQETVDEIGWDAIDGLPWRAHSDE